MDILATKDHAEREDEEAERLVRTAPRDKPSRHDKKRERMDTDRDPDVDGDPDLKSKDTSLNYKVVGSVVTRYLRGSHEERVPAIRKDTGESVLISPNTLKEKGSIYEPVKEEGDAPAPESAEAPKEEGSKEKTPAEGKPPAGGKPPAEGGSQAPASEGEPEKPKKEPKKKQTVGEKHGIGQPTRRPASIAEKQAMLLDLSDNLPPKLAAQLIAEGIHPDDAKTLLDSYKAAKSRPVGDVSKFVEKIGGVYQTDSAKVEPPGTWKNADGKKVPFESLSPEEQADAYRQHQMQVMAVSLAAKDQLSKAMSFPTGNGNGRVPSSVANRLADMLLSRSEMPDDKLQKLADSTFEEISKVGGSAKITPEGAKHILESLKGHPGAAKVAQAYLAANDYKMAKHEFKNALSETRSPKEIASTLKKAKQYLKFRAKSYGGTSDSDHYFETKVLGRLKEVDPKKYQEVRHLIGGKNSDPDLKEQGRDLWEDLLSRSSPTKTAANVAVRHSISSYLDSREMTTRSKAALYHGIDPKENYPVGASPGWTQTHQRDLGESDYTAILESAKTWLKSPVLAVGTEHMLVDQKFRHALDLAISTGPSAGQIDPRVYDMLLGRLQGSGKTASTSREQLEKLVYSRFPSDSKMRRGGQLLVMLTGKVAETLGRPSFNSVALDALSDSDLATLAKVYKVKTASQTEKVKVIFSGDGVYSSYVADDINTYAFTYQAADGSVKDNGFLVASDQSKDRPEGTEVEVEIPSGSLQSSLRALQVVAAGHNLGVRIASSSIETHRGGTPSLSFSRSRQAWGHNSFSEDHLQENVMIKLSSEQHREANLVLARLDKLAADIQANAADWGMPFDLAKTLVNTIDKTADSAEALFFGESSLSRRQAQLATEDEDSELAKEAKATIGAGLFAKAAKVIQRDADEAYMATFDNPMAPHEHDADEPYMNAFSDDQTEAVGVGSSSTGRKLSPHYG